MIPKIGTKGQIAEKLALNFLEKRGLKLVQQNFHCRFGEIDIIMQDQQTLVFVEVKFRQSTDYGHPLESITADKLTKLKKTASYYLMKNKLDAVACRFDVLGLSGDLSTPTINWIKNALD
ncbi:MAG: YraN family protein [Arenicella sp.]